jgi:hypothetical protein
MVAHSTVDHAHEVEDASSSRTHALTVMASEFIDRGTCANLHNVPVKVLLQCQLVLIGVLCVAAGAVRGSTMQCSSHNRILQEARIITVPSTSGETHRPIPSRKVACGWRLRVNEPALEPVSMVMPLAHMHSPCVRCIRSHAHEAHSCCCRCQVNHTVLLTVASPCTKVIRAFS